MSTSPTCHLYTQEALTSADLAVSMAFEVEKVYLDESHEKRYLLRCKKCGQLYFFAFYEEVDLHGGEDPQFSKYIMVEDSKAADAMALEDFVLLNKYTPRIQKDFPSDADAPKIFLVRD